MGTPAPLLTATSILWYVWQQACGFLRCLAWLLTPQVQPTAGSPAAADVSPLYFTLSPTLTIPLRGSGCVLHPQERAKQDLGLGYACARYMTSPCQAHCVDQTFRFGVCEASHSPLESQVVS